MPFLEGLAVSGVYGLLQKIFTREENLVDKVYKVFIETEKIFFVQYTDKYIKPKESFLTREENHQKMLNIVFYKERDLTYNNFNLNNYDKTPKATKEEIAYLMKTFKEILHKDLELSNLLQTKKVYKTTFENNILLKEQSKKLNQLCENRSKEQKNDKSKSWTDKSQEVDKIPYPYNVLYSGVNIHLYQLNLKYKDNNGNIITSGTNYKYVIEMYLKLIKNLFNLESIFWLSDEEKKDRKHFVSIPGKRKIITTQYFESKGILNFPDYGLVNKNNNSKWDEYNNLWQKFWKGTKEPTYYSENNEFHFALTECPVIDAENVQGALYCFLTDNPKKIPGKNAILSLAPSISDPEGALNPIVNSEGSLDKELFIYNFFRISVFLIRNIIRSLLGYKFYELHTEDEDNECIVYNPGNNPKITYDWIMKDLQFSFCEDCTKIIKSNLAEYKNENYSKFIRNALNHLENVCHVLKNKRDLFIKRDYSLFTKLKTY